MQRSTWMLKVALLADAVAGPAPSAAAPRTEARIDETKQHPDAHP